MDNFKNPLPVKPEMIDLWPNRPVSAQKTVLNVTPQLRGWHTCEPLVSKRYEK